MILLNFLIATVIAIVPPPSNPLPENAPIYEYNYYDLNLEVEIQEYITDECIRQFNTTEIGDYQLPLLIMNLIRWESGFDSSNDNGKCCGYMSVTYNLSNAIIEAEQIDDLLNPQQNIRAGIRILKNRYDEIIFFDYSDKEIISFMLEAYHTGLEIEEFNASEEYRYVNNILESYNNTKQCEKEELDNEI